MALFKKLFGKKDGDNIPKGFHLLKVSSIKKLTSDTVLVTFEIPDNLKKSFSFVPGQYLDFNISIENKSLRRSYSLCNGKGEPLSVAVKAVENGVISKWFNNDVEVGTELLVSAPQGNFTLPEDAKNVMAIAAGSGITPIMAMAKELSQTGNKLNLFYGNRTESSIIFKNELDELKNVSTTYYLSGETKSGYPTGRINKENFTGIIKSNLDLLKSDYFFVCGPEQLIIDVVDVLKLFGVQESRIKYELFTIPVLLKNEEQKVSPSFEGEAQVTVILDSEKVSFKLASKGDSVLEKSVKEGLDAPYSCKGGVCSTCKAKVLKGVASMTMNYSLTDKDVEEGYILTCQAHPASDELIITYDE